MRARSESKRRGEDACLHVKTSSMGGTAMKSPLSHRWVFNSTDNRSSSLAFHGSLLRSIQERDHSVRRARIGSVRIARQAGRKQAANAAIVMTANADPKAKGSRGLTL